MVSLLAGASAPIHKPHRADRTVPEIPMNLFTVLGLFIPIAGAVLLLVFRRSSGREKTVETGNWEDIWRERLKK
jgi:hypothetical protein